MTHQPHRYLLSLAAAVLATVTVPGLTFAQSTPSELHARHADVPRKIDGVLDDEAWSGARLPLEAWVSYNPMRGERASEQTRVWVAYDNHALYFAFKCFDTEPEKIRTNISRRDDAFKDDWVGL